MAKVLGFFWFLINKKKVGIGIISFNFKEHFMGGSHTCLMVFLKHMMPKPKTNKSMAKEYNNDP